jgi:hypothetical protein
MKHRVGVALSVAGLWGSLVSAQVRAGGEFQVNTYATGNQYQVAVAASAGGDFVVAWASRGEDGSNLGIFARRFDASGAPQGAAFPVNTFTTGAQYRPAVASDADGDSVVAWTSGQDGSGDGVFAQRYDATGALRGAEFQVNTFTTSWQLWPSVATAAAGDFVVVWASDGQDGSAYGIFGQRYDASGARRGSEFQVNSTTSNVQYQPAVASSAAGSFVVVWTNIDGDGSGAGISGQRYDGSGVPQGAEFQANTYTTGWQIWPAVASDPVGNFVVAWAGYYQDGSGFGVFGQRYDASGAPRGAEFQINSYTTSAQDRPSVAMDAAGNFVVVWESFHDGSLSGIVGRRFDASGAARGVEFQVNSYTTGYQIGHVGRAVASDAAGNFVVAWQSDGQDGSGYGAFAQRFGGLVPAALAVDPAGNGVLEADESVEVKPSWKNVNGATRTFNGVASSFGGPSATGVSYLLPDAAAVYGTVADGTTAQCSDCYEVQVTSAGTRPASHWDATLTERLSPDSLGQTKPWTLHVGGSFTDVPKTSGYYRFVETLLHNSVTGGCTASTYCPTSTSSRQQMSIFALVAKEGASYTPRACGATPMFADVPVTSPYCKWVEELARRGVVGGCGGGNFCPTGAVTRGQMPIFVLKTLDPTLDPPACGATPMFADVPTASPYCKWIEELARRGVVSGCGGGNYCPSSAVNRAQMAVFISGTFGLTLYGP